MRRARDAADAGLIRPLHRPGPRGHDSLRPPGLRTRPARQLGRREGGARAPPEGAPRTPGRMADSGARRRSATRPGPDRGSCRALMPGGSSHHRLHRTRRSRSACPGGPVRTRESATTGAGVRIIGDACACACAKAEQPGPHPALGERVDHDGITARFADHAEGLGRCAAVRPGADRDHVPAPPPMSPLPCPAPHVPPPGLPLPGRGASSGPPGLPPETPKRTRA